eukprot:NODE_299_length_1825_cov_238.367680_g241_i0.p1 GENE.NODE_299_length_1825_cov_238.367680_g241_i0~~NODE_299_length_1825_cov_238.367680_g241_i0.p1  ORF type:complete len:525 (-),score=111.77 NODE_299_length_1825_cov_238.367680_g241_i0:170-1744(-)
MDPAMEFGGYVRPPKHLTKAAKRNAPPQRPAELRTIPDYDYSLFRYSKLALPFLVLIILTAAVLLGLTFWQGPWGIGRGKNGFDNGIPTDFTFDRDGVHEEAGLSETLRTLRCVNFALGVAATIVAVFAIRSGAATMVVRILLILAALIYFALFVLSIVTMISGIHQVERLVDCPDTTFPQLHYSPTISDRYDPSTNCWRREQLTSATIAADAATALAAGFTCFLIIFTLRAASWAWGPGRISVDQAINQKQALFPPPSPFTHIAETRRAYVWMGILFTLAFVIVAFILTMVMHELRDKPRLVDERNRVILKSGWSKVNNRLRASVAGAAIAFGLISLLDMAGWKRRLVAYVLAVLLLWTAVGAFVSFGMDVNDLTDQDELPCRRNNNIFKPKNAIAKVLDGKTGLASLQFRNLIDTLIDNDDYKCTKAPYISTTAIDFLLGFFIIVYIIYEFLYRVNATWDTFFFYADSEWLRNHSFLVDRTDREAFDWKKFVMDSGKEYYYSPSLGLSTRMRPRNYIETEVW